MKTCNFPQRREKRRVDAQARQELRDVRTPKQQLDILDETLGKDVGARSERARLRKVISRMPENKKK